MLTPITALWAAILGLLSVALAARVVQGRVSEKVIFGDGASVVMQQRIRVHANFIEYVPIALVLARLLHAFGLSSNTGTTPGRFVGTVLTWLVILAESVLLLYFRLAV